jgi:hypothetical protein
VSKAALRRLPYRMGRRAVAVALVDPESLPRSPGVLLMACISAISAVVKILQGYWE